MSGAPRPLAPAILYATFTTHQATCQPCATTNHPCPYGEHLLEAWGDSDRFARSDRDSCSRCAYYKRGTDGRCVNCGARWPLPTQKEASQ